MIFLKKVGLCRPLRIKFRNSYNSLNLFSGVRKGASLVPICSIVYMYCIQIVENGD